MKNKQLTEKTKVIKKVFGFDMGAVTRRYASDYNLDAETAQEHEQELKRFLALCILYPQHSFAMESKVVDSLWHTFIWHTPDYFRFCELTAGRYLHHQPTPEGASATQNTAETDTVRIIDAYKETFGEYPPLHIWPNASMAVYKHMCSHGTGPGFTYSPLFEVKAA